MAYLGLRTSVPAVFNSLDQLCGASGSPSSAWLGRELAQRDRWLDAHLRRGIAYAFPLGQTGTDHFGRNAGGRFGDVPLAVGSGQGGCLLGWMDWIGTPGAEDHQAVWYLRAKITNGAEVLARAVFFNESLGVESNTGMPSTVLTGTGAAVTYEIPAQGLGAQPYRIGVRLWVPVEAAALSSNSAEWIREREVATGVDLGPLGLDVHEGDAIRILDPASGEYLTDWLSIVGFSSTDNGATADVAVTGELIIAGHRAWHSAYGLQWEIRRVESMRIYSAAYYEVA